MKSQFSAICVLIAFALPAFADGSDWLVAKPAPVRASSPIESDWILDKDGSYVRTLRRPAPTAQTRPTPQATTETWPVVTYYSTPVYTTPAYYTVPGYYAVPTRRGGYRYVAGEVCVGGT